MVAEFSWKCKTGQIPMAHEVFISYCSADKAIAIAVCHTLESHGIRCWIAPRDVTPGLPYAECLVKAIASSKEFVLVFSEGVNTSQHVMREVERAVCREIPIIPFRIEDATPRDSMEYFLSSPHWLDATTPPIEQHMDQLVTVVQALLNADHERCPRNGALGRPASIISEGPVPHMGPVEKQTTTTKKSIPAHSVVPPKARTWRIGLAATVLTIILYAAVLAPLQGAGMAIGEMFVHRGAMPYFMTFTFLFVFVSLLSGFWELRCVSRRTSEEAFPTIETPSFRSPTSSRDSDRAMLNSNPFVHAIRAKVRCADEGVGLLDLKNAIELEEKADLSVIKERHSSDTRLSWLIVFFGILGSLLGLYEAFRSLVGGPMLMESIEVILLGSYTAFEPTLLGIAMAMIVNVASYLFRLSEVHHCETAYDHLRDVVMSLVEDQKGLRTEAQE